MVNGHFYEEFYLTTRNEENWNANNMTFDIYYFDNNASRLSRSPSLANGRSEFYGREHSSHNLGFPIDRSLSRSRLAFCPKLA